MSKYLHNISGIEKEYQGLSIPINGVFEIPPHFYLEFSRNSALESDIQSQHIKVSRDGINYIESIDNALAYIKIIEQRSSLAVDKDGVDQFTSGTTDTVINSERVIWDINNDYNTSEDCFIVPFDGVYSFDCQVRVKDISNCSFIELAIFKKTDEVDDYWFVIDRKEIGVQTSIQLAGATLFDFYKNEEYDLRIILTKNLPLIQCSCVIDGDNDYTAWGFDLNQVF